MSKNVWIATIAVIILVAGAWWLLRSQSPAAPQVAQPTAVTPTTQPAASSAATVAETQNLVTIAKDGFSPKNITIKPGGMVTWMNNDTVDHTVNSAPHPVHTAYPPLNLGVIKPGEKKSLTFPDAGTYKYHDHLNPSLFGSVTVQ